MQVQPTYHDCDELSEDSYVAKAQRGSTVAISRQSQALSFLHVWRIQSAQTRLVMES